MKARKGMEERFTGSLLYQTLRKREQYPTIQRERTIELSGGVDLVAKLNPRRLTLLITNRSLSVVDIGFTPEHKSGTGIMLGPNGGTLVLTWLEDGELVGSDVYAVGTPGATLYIIEVEASVTGGGG